MVSSLLYRRLWAVEGPAQRARCSGPSSRLWPVEVERDSGLVAMLED